MFDRMIEIRTAQQADEIMQQDLAVIFKHSTRCPISARAHEEMRRYLSMRGQTPVYLVDVIKSREVSQHIERTTGVQHESPQLIIVRKGKAHWHASHGSIVAEAVAEETPASAAAS